MAQMQTEHKTDKSAGEVIGSVLSQAKDGLISFGETIASKSKEMVNNAKVNAQVAALEKENDENYIKLGKMVREKEEYTDEMREIGKKIDENEKQIEQIEAQQNDGSDESGQDSKDLAQGREDDHSSPKLSLIHISEPTRQAEISYAVFCLKKKKKQTNKKTEKK